MACVVGPVCGTSLVNLKSTSSNPSYDALTYYYLRQERKISFPGGDSAIQEGQSPVFIKHPACQWCASMYEATEWFSGTSFDGVSARVISPALALESWSQISRNRCVPTTLRGRGPAVTGGPFYLTFNLSPGESFL